MGRDLPTSRSRQHSSLASHLPGQNCLSPRDMPLQFSQNRALKVQSRSYSRPPRLKLKHTPGASGIRIKANYFSLIPRNRAAFDTQHCPGGPRSPISWFLSRFLPHSLQSCGRLPDSAPTIPHGERHQVRKN